MSEIVCKAAENSQGHFWFESLTPDIHTIYHISYIIYHISYIIYHISYHIISYQSYKLFVTAVRQPTVDVDLQIEITPNYNQNKSPIKYKFR